MVATNVFAQRQQRRRKERPAEVVEEDEGNDDSTPTAVAEKTGGIIAPNQVGANRRMAAFVSNERKNKRRGNTAVAYDPKRDEFEQFCESEFKDDKSTMYVVDNEKVYRFMFYTAMRNKKKTGGRRKKNAPKPKQFSKSDYDEVAGPFFENKPEERIIKDVKKPTNPLKWQQFNTYRTVLKNLHEEQRSKGCNSNGWDIVWTCACKELEKMVKERMPEFKRLTFQEKLDGEMAPCKIVEKFDEIEAMFWKDSANARGERDVCSHIRHRCCFLYLTSGILRSESAHGNDISDFFGLRPPQKRTDIHRMFLMINQIVEGKTCHSARQWGRATRHKIVIHCCIGGVSFYLALRLFLTNEFQDMTVEQWMDNSSWFNIKFLIDTNGGDNTTAMSSDTYGDHVKKILLKLGLPANKKLHLGRNLGTKKLDCQEVDPEEVRRMGQWNMTVCDASHSSKLPMKAIRNLAGYDDHSGIYFNTRTIVKPSDYLLRQTPFGFAFDMRKELQERDAEGLCTAAAGALEFFEDMAEILLQDAAAIMVKHEDRKEHPIFKEIPLFESDEFQEHVEKMRKALETEKDPLDAELQAVLPGVHERLNAANSAIEQNRIATTDLEKMVDTKFTGLTEAITEGFQGVANAMDGFVNGCSDQLEMSLGQSLVHAGNLLTSQQQQQSPDRTSGFTMQTPPASPEIQITPTATEEEDVVVVPAPTQQPRRKGTHEVQPEDHRSHRMLHCHDTLRGVWEEWFGLGTFEDGCEGIDGGNRLHGARWRKHLQASEYSYRNRIIKGAGECAKNSNSQPEDVIDEWEPLCQRVGESCGNLVKELQRLGKLPKKKPRGAKKKSQQATQQATQ